MQSNNKKRRLNGRDLAAALAGVIVVLAVMGLMPMLTRASMQVEAGAGMQNLTIEEQRLNVMQADHAGGGNGLTLLLHLRKQGTKRLMMVNDGCYTLEANASAYSACDKADGRSTQFNEAAGISWNGKAGGSGCVIVGGNEYCW